MTLPGNLSTLKIIVKNTGKCVVSPVVAIRTRQGIETHEKHGLSERKSGGWIVGEIKIAEGTRKERTSLFLASVSLFRDESDDHVAACSVYARVAFFPV